MVDETWFGSLCSSGASGSGLPDLAPKVSTFPSLNSLHKACPGVPTVRDLQMALDEGWTRFIRAWGDGIESVFRPLLRVLVWTEERLLAMPWWLVLILMAALVWGLTRSVRITVAILATFAVIGFFGMWTETMQTLSFITVCTLICLVLGIPIGILLSRNDRLRSLVVPLMDFLQTMPSFVYLIPVVMLFGIGKVAGAIAVIAYAISPVIRLTVLGIRGVDHETIEAAESFGVSPLQKLLGVQLPLAMPTIMAGINQTIMMALSMVVVASMVAVRGLGMPVLEAIQELRLSKGLFYGLAVVALAIVFDRVTKAAINRGRKHVAGEDE